MSRDSSNHSTLLLTPGPLPLSEEERAKILEIALERMVMINNKVYGLEDETEPEAEVDCGSRIKSCKAICCTYAFALTQEEAKRGIVKYNAKRPFYIARDADGYCLTSTARLSNAASMRNVPCGAENMRAVSKLFYIVPRAAP